MAGFTLIELMIVSAIILILIGMAVMKYDRVVLRSREAVLKNDLVEMRKAIDSYTLDRQAAPQSLQDLASPPHQYLHEIPIDPITHQKDWQEVIEDVALGPDQASGAGITDVHSSSSQTSSEGTAYNTW